MNQIRTGYDTDAANKMSGHQPYRVVADYQRAVAMRNDPLWEARTGAEASLDPRDEFECRRQTLRDLLVSLDDAERLIAGLTPRQHQIMDLVLAGHPNKNIAADLGISQRTVENHRAAIMRRTGTKCLAALVRLALAAALCGADRSMARSNPVFGHGVDQPDC